MKKWSLLLIFMLLLGMTGCDNGLASSPAASESPTESETVEEISETEEPAEPAEMFTFEDSMLTMVVEMSHASYTVDEIIDVSVTIINKSGRVLQYVQGSGSAIVPDALQISLSGLNPLFIPAIQTLDYQVSTLEPGQVASFDCPFAPYIPNSGEFSYGTEHDLDFFKQGDFTPASAGILVGTVSFAYMPVPEDAEATPLPMSEENTVTLGGEFTTAIA